MKFEEYLCVRENQENELFEKSFLEMMKDIENRIETIKKLVLQELQDGKNRVVIKDPQLLISPGKKWDGIPSFGNTTSTLIGQTVELSIYNWLKAQGFLAYVEWGPESIVVVIYSLRLKERMERYYSESVRGASEVGDYVQIEDVKSNMPV